MDLNLPRISIGSYGCGPSCKAEVVKGACCVPDPPVTTTPRVPTLICSMHPERSIVSTIHSVLQTDESYIWGADSVQRPGLSFVRYQTRGPSIRLSSTILQYGEFRGPSRFKLISVARWWIMRRPFLGFPRVLGAKPHDNLGTWRHCLDHSPL